MLDRMNATLVAAVARVTWTPELDERVKELVTLGHDDEQVADAMGITYEAARHRRIRLKLLRECPDKFDWTPEREQQLAQLRAKGIPCAQIATKLGATRRAIIGKAWRLGLPKPARQAKPKAKKRGSRDNGGGLIRRMTAKTSRPATPYQTIIDTNIPIEQRKTLIELEAHHCRWPIGDPCKSDFFFCGAVPLKGRPYCAAHHARAYENRGPD